MPKKNKNISLDDITISLDASSQESSATSVSVNDVDIAAQIDDVLIKENTSSTSQRPNHVYSYNMQKVIDFLSQYKGRKENKLVIEILKNIEEELAEFGNEKLSEIYASVNEEGVIGISWEIKDALLGFTLRPIENNSTWFLIIGEKDKKWRAYGDLDNFDEEKILNSIISILK
jgi:hypothetical protein